MGRYNSDKIFSGADTGTKGPHLDFREKGELLRSRCMSASEIWKAKCV